MNVICGSHTNESGGHPWDSHKWKSYSEVTQINIIRGSHTIYVLCKNTHTKILPLRYFKKYQDTQFMQLAAHVYLYIYI